jgi:hypothetical protein
MKNSKALLAVVLMAMIAIAVVMLLHNDKQKRTKARTNKPPVVKVAPVAKPARPVVKAEPVRRPSRDEARQARKPSPDKHKEPATLPLAGASVMVMPVAEGTDKHVPLHVAREALKLVGSDPVAENIWTDAINNPALPPADRKNLIEDLNEAGFADPQQLKPEELPLIQHRIALIERLAPTALDEVNAAAFAEAYKDLKAMATRLTQPPAQPQPEQLAMQAQPEQPAAQPQPEQLQPQPDQPQPQPEQPAPQPQQ